MESTRAVWDTNVFISTFVLHGRSVALAHTIFERGVLLVVSEPVLAEYYEVASRPRFHGTRQEVHELLRRLSPWFHLVRNPTPLHVAALRDASDVKFLECAVNGQARYLVTGDRDLLVLKRYQGVTICSPRTFLEALDRS